MVKEQGSNLFVLSSLIIAVISALSFFGGVILTSTDSLTLDQAPTERGTMMSTNSVAMKLGNAIGAGLGG
ncbi:hypothetical protein JXL21_12325 [Candidatus Bathyarchaeota archaeon]|nr:hypothetical protein [Candidatus Bathyarchaeota archaeon]